MLLYAIINVTIPWTVPDKRVASACVPLTATTVQSINQSIRLYFRQKPVERTTKKTQTQETEQNRHTEEYK